MTPKNRKTKTDETRPASTAGALWRVIVERGGLQTARKGSGGPGYDHAFALEVARRLGLAPSPFIVRELARKGVTVEALLETVLAAAQPWARMMTDILRMFEAAGAARAGDGLQLKLNLDKVAPALARTLSAFRMEARTAMRITHLSSGPQWGALDPYALFPEREGDWPRRASAATPMLIWADLCSRHDRDSPGGRDDPPQFSASGVGELDRELRRLHRFLTSLMTAMRAAGPTYNSRVHARRDDGLELGDGWTAPSAARAESDFAMAALAERFEWLILDPDSSPALRRNAAATLKAGLDQAPQGSAMESLAEQLMDMFDLPAWKRRHELYSVWISTIVADALPRDGFSWSLTDGTLSYSFAGSELAYGALPGGGWTFWAELRRPLPVPGSGKRKNVQPDYSLLLGADEGVAPAGLIVECKQYRKSSYRNFQDALLDYSLAHPDAHVLLANYGPVGESVGAGLAESREAPVCAFGAVHPLGSGLRAFTLAVEEAVRDMAARAQEETDQAEMAALIEQHRQEAARQEIRKTRIERGVPVENKVVAPADPLAVAEISLRWDNASDLDLHVRHIDVNASTEIQYNAKGSPDTPPFLTLDCDVTDGPGTETVTFRQWHPGRYEVEVHRFRGEWPPSFVVWYIRRGFAQSSEVYPGSEDRIRVLSLEVPSDWPRS